MNEPVVALSSRLTVTRAGAVHLGCDERVSRHATQAFKLVVAIDGELVIEHEGERATHRAVLVAPYVAQTMWTRGAAIGFFAEPGTRGLGFERAGPLTIPDAVTTEALSCIARDAAIDGGAVDGAALDAVFGFFRQSTPRLDKRVDSAMRWLASDPAVSVQAVADQQRMSATRLRHLVQQATGFPLRAHRLWHRTLRAIELQLQGRSLATAASEAGFADQAHFTRSFTRFFGRTPSSVPRDVRLEATWIAR